MGSEKTEKKTAEKIAAKHIVWMVVAGLAAASLTLIAIFGDATGQAWVERIAFLLVGLVIPGSPLGGIARKAAPVALTALAVMLVSGCGASALAIQARAATVATVALEGAHRLAMDVTEARLGACEDRACVETAKAELAPIGLAHVAARTALEAWLEALDVARIAGEDGDVVSALLVAAGRWLALWDPLAAALAGVGVEVPRLPPLVTGLLGGGR